MQKRLLECGFLDSKNSMKKRLQTIVLVHGSWHGGWCWIRVQKLLTDKGYEVFSPTLSGMKIKNDPEAKESGLHKHINQIVELINLNQLESVILVGHSYAGLVITGVMHRIPERIKKVVYLDAFLPDHDQSLFDISLPERVMAIKNSLTDDEGKTLEQGAKNVWLVPVRPAESFGVINPIDMKWLTDNMVPTPIKTFEEKVSANNPKTASIPKYYIRCLECSILEKSEEKAKKLGYHMFSIEAGHDAMITAPEETSNILVEISEANEALE